MPWRMKARPRVLIANGNDDVLAALEETLTSAGYEAKIVHVRAIRLGTIDFVTLFQEFRPSVAIVDIGPPYPENWAFAQTLVKHPVASHVPFLWTTTNGKALTEFTGAKVPELLLKPYDLDMLLERLQRRLGDLSGRPRLPTPLERSGDAEGAG
jgi:DNA-binding response OmpR family regulator